MEEIRLQNCNWFYDPTQQLGPAGGFGVVFAGQSATGQRVAIKQLKIDADASAHRELRVASLFENQNTSNVIPIYDSGEDANSGRYFVVMALADKSLQSDMNAGQNGAPYRFYHPDMAIGPGMNSYQVAFGPRPIDDEDEAEFIERWTTMFAAAAEGRLKYPSRLPLSADYWKNLGVYGM
jgi:hypothetical protein